MLFTGPYARQLIINTGENDCQKWTVFVLTKSENNLKLTTGMMIVYEVRILNLDRSSTTFCFIINYSISII